MERIYASTRGGTLKLGRQGENEAREVAFDISRWKQQYGDGVVSLVHQRNGDQYPYPCNIIIDDSGMAIWTLRRPDVAIAGDGECELSYTIGGTVVKSAVYGTYVARSIAEEVSGEIPDAAQSWVDSIIKIAAESGKSAYEIAVQHGFIGTEEEWLESLVGRPGDQGAQGEKGDQGIQGKKGEKGDKGDKGDPGYTPIKGVDYFDGKDGNNGYTPVKGQDYFTLEDVSEIVDKVIEQMPEQPFDDIADAIEAAKAYATNQDAVVLAEAKAYTDKKVESGINSWNDLNDKPFGDEVVSLGDTLTWDGQPTDEYIEYSGMRIYRVSSSVPDIDEWIGATISVSTNSEVITITENDVFYIADSVYNVSDAIFVAMSDDTLIEIDGGAHITILHKGIYCINYSGEYVTSCHIQNYDFKKPIFKSIDPKYLPEGGFGYIEPEKEILPETVLSALGEDFSGIYGVPIDVELGKTYKITVDGVSITGKAKSSIKNSIKIYYVGNAALFDSDLPDTEEDFVLVKYFQFFGLAADVCFITHRGKKYPDTITASIKLCDNVVQIDSKYLPTDGFGYVEVKHIGGDTITWDGSPTDITLGNTGRDWEIIDCLVSGKVPTLDQLRSGTLKIYNIESGMHEIDISSVDDFETYEHDTYYAITNGDLSITVALVDGATTASGSEIYPKKGIYFSSWVMQGVYVLYISELTIPGFDFAETEIHKIDEKFLPDTVARVEDISKAIFGAMEASY